MLLMENCNFGQSNFMNLPERLNTIKNSIPQGVTLIAVSKTQSVDSILQAYGCGQKIFGENKAQELVFKAEQLPGDIQWHFIGHLQSNKVKMLLPYTALIHSVDSKKLLQIINSESLKINKITNCLLQFFIAREETKFGLDLEEAMEILSSAEFPKMKHIRICGVMGMATYTSNQAQIRAEFKQLYSIFTQIKQIYFADNDYFNEISMGMTDDYQTAMEEGSTMVRIGTAIFGERGRKIEN